MPRFLFLSLTFCGILTAEVLPYKPKPILWVHGIAGSSIDWGAGVYKSGEVKTDSIHPDSVIPGSSYDHFLKDYMLPIAEVWHGYEVSHGLPWTYTIPTMSSYPNKTFLEVINTDKKCRITSFAVLPMLIAINKEEVCKKF